MTLFEHEKKLLEDEQYRKNWTEQDLRRSSEWFVEQIYAENKQLENKQ